MALQAVHGTMIHDISLTPTVCQFLIDHQIISGMSLTKFRQLVRDSRRLNLSIDLLDELDFLLDDLDELIDSGLYWVLKK